MRLNSISAEPMAVIRIPKTPRSAYNPKRPAGTLLQSQLKHLEWAVRPAGQRTAKAFRPKAAYSEAEAAARIATLNQTLQEQAATPRGVMPPNPVSPSIAAATPRSKPRRAAKRKPKARKQAKTRARRSTRR